MRKVAVLILAGVVLLLAGIRAAWLPVTYTKTIYPGTWTHKAYYPIWQKRSQADQIKFENNIHALGLILVNYSHAANPKPAIVELSDEDNNILAQSEVSIDTVPDGEMVWIDFPTLNSAGKTLTLTVTAPDANKDEMLGLRFDLERERHVALAVKTKVPLWQYYAIKTAQRAFLVKIIGLGIAALITLAIIIEKVMANKRKRGQTAVFWVALTLIAAAAFVLRWYSFDQLHGVSGGDAYNYLTITKSLAEFSNPFAADKRLPLWPLIMLPVYLLRLDLTWWMQFFSIVSSIGSIVALALLARQLKLPASAQLIAPTLLAVQKDFWQTSLRPEPYSLYGLLLLLALLFYFQLEKKWAQAALGICLGLAAMTRQEGFVLAFVLGIAVLCQFRTIRWPGLARVIGPAFLLVSPFIVNSALSFGNPIYTPYFNAGRLNQPDSWPSLLDNMGATWGVLGSMWRNVWNNLTRVDFADSFLWFGFALAIIASAVHWPPKIRKSKIFNGVIFALGVASAANLVFWFDLNSGIFFDRVMKLLVGASAAGIITVIFRWRWRGAVLVAVLLSQVAIATWFHPFPKHFQQDYPLIILLISISLAGVSFWPRGKKSTQNSWEKFAGAPFHLAVLLPPLFVFSSLLTMYDHAADQSNQNTAIDHVIYQSLLAARSLPAPFALDAEYQPTPLLLGSKTLSCAGKSAPDCLKTLDANGVRTFITTNIYKSNLLLPSNWQQVFRVVAEGKDEKKFKGEIYVRLIQ